MQNDSRNEQRARMDESADPVIANVAGRVMARYDEYDWRPIEHDGGWLHAFVSVLEAESCYRSSAFGWTDGRN